MLIEMLTVGPVSTNCYLYSADGKNAVVIDPAAEPEEIIGHLRGLDLEAVALVNTHGHLDHTGANAVLKEMLGVPILIGERDAPYLGPGAEALHRQDALIIGPEARALFQEYYAASPPADVLLTEGAEIAGGGLRVVETPGHTAGSISLLGEGVAFVGDALFAGSVGRTDLCGGDERALLASVREKILSLPPETEIFSGHGPPTTVAAEKAHNPFFK
ncbi:MAG: MBL fold metallo-hydrolase [Candidatus Coatesbacteria bacterium]|nr:MAG: MBL fold metallo-hydrolase [Candidatus Coatesbacteria bacterium]